MSCGELGNAGSWYPEAPSPPPPPSSTQSYITPAPPWHPVPFLHPRCQAAAGSCLANHTVHSWGLQLVTLDRGRPPHPDSPFSLLS